MTGARVAGGRGHGGRIRFALRRPGHPFVLALAAMLLVYYVVEAISFLHLNTMSPVAVLVAAVEAAAVAVLPFSPGVGCWLVGLVYPLSHWESVTATARGAITTGIPPRAVAELIVMYALGVAVAAYFNLANGLTLAIVLACVAPLVTADTNAFGDGTGELTGFLALGLAAAMLGAGTRLAKERVAAARVQRQKQQEMTVAAQLHDHLCNELTVLLLETSQDPGFAALPNAGEYTEALQRSIAQTRAIISELDGKRRTTHQHAAGAARQRGADALRSAIDRRKRHLDALGFTGMAYVNVPDGLRFPDAATAGLADDLVTELFGNIARHADPAGGYFLSVSASATILTVSLADTPRTDEPDIGGAAHESTGIRRLQERVLAAGGTLEVEATPGRWSLIARIPLA